MLLLHGDPWRYATHDIRDGLDRIEDSVDTSSYGGDLDPAYFRTRRTYLSLAEISDLANPDYWLDATPGEIAGASAEEIYEWAQLYGGQRFAYNVSDLLDHGMSAVVVMDAEAFRGLIDGRGRLNLAVALGMNSPLPVLLLRDIYPSRQA